MVLSLSLQLNQRKELLSALLGSLFLAFCSLIWIPFQPVAFTLQELGVILLALWQSPKVCFLSLTFYLLEATLGLPVLCGVSHSLWFTGSSAGYLFAFPFAGYCISWLSRKNATFYWQFFSILCGQILIYFLGFIWLAQFIGSVLAFKWGVLFFLPSAILKNFIGTKVKQWL
jgi:biotin transport system substrate-specific component